MLFSHVFKKFFKANIINSSYLYWAGIYVGNEVNISISQTNELKYLGNSSLEPKAKSKINYFQRQINSVCFYRPSLIPCQQTIIILITKHLF